MTNTSRPGIFGPFLLQYRGFAFSEVKNIILLVRPFGTKIFVLLWRFYLMYPLFGGSVKRGSTI